MLIIGLGHRRYVGKNAVGEIMAEKLVLDHDFHAVRTCAFADPVYEVLHTMFGWAGFHTKDFYDENPEQKGITLSLLNETPRDLLIRFATQTMRQKFHQDIWTNCLFQNCDFADAMVITDVRFPNEAEAIKERGGFLVNVVRNGIPYSEDVADMALMSFTAWDYIFENNSELDDLEITVPKFLEEILHDYSRKSK